RGQARVRRQRPIRRANPDLPPFPPPRTYAAHQIGALSAEMIICLAAIIIPGQSGTYRHLRDRVTGLLAESGLIGATGLTAAHNGGSARVLPDLPYHSA